jgi:hypothetical protein
MIASRRNRAIERFPGVHPAIRALGPALSTLLLATPVPTAPAVGQEPALRVESGVTESGAATGQWLTMLRRRLPDAAYDSVAPLRKRLTPEERSWAALVRSRLTAWQGEIAGVAAPYRPALPPAATLIVLGNRGASDAFTHDPATIGFDLSALQAEYGDATREENPARIDRLFRHEYAHLMQKAWAVAHPYPMDTPLRLALAEMWTEGLGNWHSLSARWRATAGAHSPTAAAALAELEPRLVARLAALACATPGRAARLTTDLSWGRFDRKWGAVVPALWLEAETSRAGTGALRDFVEAGPDGAWALAERNLAPPLAAALREVRVADSLCAMP